ncbi:MAG TPA: hypothetical protein VN853_04740, partial [Polyangia bacterium]|nr:hypothetical protein [Polyangia bacterium]
EIVQAECSDDRWRPDSIPSEHPAEDTAQLGDGIRLVPPPVRQDDAFRSPANHQFYGSPQLVAGTEESQVPRRRAIRAP